MIEELPMPSLCNAAFVALATLNIETLIQFYSQVLGRSPSPHIPQVYAEFQLPGLRLGIFCPNTANQPEFASAANSTMSLCLEVTALEAAIAHLTALGYPPMGAIMTASHGREIYAYDPDGNRLILHQSM